MILSVGLRLSRDNFSFYFQILKPGRRDIDISLFNPLKIIPNSFFERDPREVAPDLLGKVLRHRIDGCWLEARIIETEAYLLEERGSHASLGETPSRRALFMEAGTIYMYYARGGDSFNFSYAILQKRPVEEEMTLEATRWPSFGPFGFAQSGTILLDSPEFQTSIVVSSVGRIRQTDLLKK